MKKLKITLLMLSCFSLLYSCSEWEAPLEDMSDAVVVLPGSEDNVLNKAREDWANINEALQNACPGEVVQLGVLPPVAYGQNFLNSVSLTL